MQAGEIEVRVGQVGIELQAALVTRGSLVEALQVVQRDAAVEVQQGRGRAVLQGGVAQAQQVGVAMRRVEHRAEVQVSVLEVRRHRERLQVDGFSGRGIRRLERQRLLVEAARV